MKIVLVSKCSLDIKQYVEFKMTVLISPSKSLISSRWVTYSGRFTFPTVFSTLIQCEIAQRFPRSVVKVGLNVQCKNIIILSGVQP